MGMGPCGRPAPPDPAMAQHELAEAMPGTGAVGEQIGAGAAQVPHRLLGHGRDADGHQLAGAVQPGQPAAVTTVGLDPIPGRGRDQRGRNHLAAHMEPSEQPGQLVTGGAGLIAARSLRGSGNRATSLRTDGSSWAIRSTSGASWSGRKTATEIVSRCTSKPR